MDWETLYWPNRCCRYSGRPFRQSALIKNGASRGHTQALCQACGRSVFLRYGTAYFDVQADPVVFETPIRALAEGNALRSTARSVQLAKDTACAWLDRAAQQCRQTMVYLWQRVHVTECQLEERWSVVPTKEANLPGAKQWCATYGDAWVWLAIAGPSRLVVAFVVGERTQQSANLLLSRVALVTDETIPFCTSDQVPE